jgi:methylphosphotriester-DNA--protein-cysteine methyltransferase
MGVPSRLSGGIGKQGAECGTVSSGLGSSSMKPTNAGRETPRAGRAQLLAAAATEGDPRWAAVRARDQRADGTFYYSVATTGVYCRPSCASRLARPENVAFHASRADAERAGYRACKRCKPDQPPLAVRQAALVARLCRLIETSEDVPTLEALAGYAGLSAFHAHRLFKSVTGVTRGLTPRPTVRDASAGICARSAR